MQVSTVDIPGLLVIEPDVFGDARGFFLETYNKQRYSEAGLDATFVQDNLSFSRRGILRGLHSQNPSPQGKLVYVLQGAVFDVAVDGRSGSPTFGKWYGLELSSENKRQFTFHQDFFTGFASPAKPRCSPTNAPTCTPRRTRWASPGTTRTSVSNGR